MPNSRDTQDELRLVEGWQDEVFTKFADQFTIYGSGKLNINCGDDQIHWAILHSSFIANPPVTDAQTQDYIDLINEQKMLIGFSKTKDYADYLKQLGLEVDPKLLDLLTDQPLTFRIASTGLVGNSAVSITQVVQYNTKGRAKLLYHRVD